MSLSLKDFFKTDEIYTGFTNNSKTELGTEYTDNSVKVFDHEWVGSSFMAKLSTLSKEDKRIALTQNSFLKFKNYRLGGNIAVNMPPGNNYLADPLADDSFKVVGLNSERKNNGGVTYGPTLSNIGMGRWYSDNIDDHTQTVIMQFGLPRFNSIFSFLTNSTSYIDSYIANTGKLPTWYAAGKIVGNAAKVYGAPLLAITVWSFKLGITLLTGNKPYQYYYFEPDMGAYWRIVNDIANYFATKIGIIGYEMDWALGKKDIDASKGVVSGKAYALDDRTKTMFLKLYAQGDAGVGASVTSYIDIYNIISRRFHIFNNVRRKVVEDRAKDTNTVDTDTLDTLKGPNASSLGDTEFTDKEKADRESVYKYIKSMVTKVEEMLGDKPADDLELESPENVLKREYIKEEEAKKKEEEKKKEAEERKNAREYALEAENKSSSYLGVYVNTAVSGLKAVYEEGAVLARSIWDWVWTDVKSDFGVFATAFQSSVRGATSAAIFAVNPTGSTSDSFSNSTSSIGTGDMIKSLGKAAHDIRFSIGAGHSGYDALDGLIDRLFQFGAGVVESATFGLSNIVNTLINGGFMDIPEKWEDSSASFNTCSYTMDLVSPYGNEFSRFKNLYVPLAMILAGALPRGVGKASYTSPFLCTCYSKSTQNISLGIITDVSVTSGITNQPFVRGMKTNSLRVTFSVKDLSNIVSARINTSSLFGEYRPIIEEDTPLARWINRIAGVDLEDLSFVLPRLRNNVSIFGKSIGNIYDSNRLGHNLGNIFFDSSVLSMVFKNPFYQEALMKN